MSFIFETNTLSMINVNNLLELWIRSNVALQICLHFNKYLNYIWLGSQYFLEKNVTSIGNNKTSSGLTQNQVADFLWHASLLLFFATEGVRLYCGNVGNLHEKVSNVKYEHVSLI